MKNVLFIIPPELYRDEEILEPMDHLKKNGFKWEIASTVIERIKGMKGGELLTSLKIDEADTHAYDALVVIGGQGTKKHLWNHAPTIRQLQKAHREGKIIAGICAGSVVVAQTGLLADLQAATFPAADYILELKKNGAEYVNDDVIVSGKIITATGPDAAKEFGRTLVNEMTRGTNAAKKPAKKVHESISIPFTTPFNDV